MRIKLFSAVLAVIALLPVGNGLPTSLTKAPTDVPAPGNQACASCHLKIYQSYVATAMGRASGPALNGFVPGEFDNKVSGVRYRVYERDGRVWMSYERGRDLTGTREFLYFIGSGRKGRTYLFSADRYLFEAPINWYSQENRWNMTPAYTQARAMPMNLPAFSSCLNCHTSGVQPHVSGTTNRYPDRPFLHEGISCERCHGSGKVPPVGRARRGTMSNVSWSSIPTTAPHAKCWLGWTAILANARRKSKCSGSSPRSLDLKTPRRLTS